MCTQQNLLASEYGLFIGGWIDYVVTNMSFGVAWSVEWCDLESTEFKLFVIFADIVDFRNPCIGAVKSQTRLFS